MSGTFEHHFEVSEIAVDGTTTLVETGTVAPTTASTTYTVRTALVNGGRYRWRVRAGLDGFVGPWSVWATFRYVRIRAGLERRLQLLRHLSQGVPGKLL